jgi:flagellin-like protein
MNMKMKRQKSRKALSPVVASIILIAVTVAVSIAVAAWMGALTFSFTATEQVNITNMTFTVGSATTGHILIVANNTGTSAVTINEAWVNNIKQSSIVVTPASTTGGLPASIPANTGLVLNITINVVNGYSYQVKLITAKGNTFLYTGSAPS